MTKKFRKEEISPTQSETVGKKTKAHHSVGNLKHFLEQRRLLLVATGRVDNYDLKALLKSTSFRLCTVT